MKMIWIEKFKLCVDGVRSFYVEKIDEADKIKTFNFGNLFFTCTDLVPFKLSKHKFETCDLIAGQMDSTDECQPPRARMLTKVEMSYLI